MHLKKSVCSREYVPLRKCSRLLSPIFGLSSLEKEKDDVDITMQRDIYLFIFTRVQSKYKKKKIFRDNGKEELT